MWAVGAAGVRLVRRWFDGRTEYRVAYGRPRVVLYPADRSSAFLHQILGYGAAGRPAHDPLTTVVPVRVFKFCWSGLEYRLDSDSGIVELNLDGLRSFLAHVPPQFIEQVAADKYDGRLLSQWWSLDYHNPHSGQVIEGEVIQSVAVALVRSALDRGFALGGRRRFW